MSDANEILEQLASEDTEVIREAAWKAGEMGLVQAVPLLAGLLCRQNLGVQEASEHALRKIGGSATVRAVMPLLRSDDAPVRNMSMDILREVGDQDFTALIELLHDQDTDIRIFATDILGSTNNLLAVPPLCEALLKDPEVNVRYQAAVSLGDLAFKEAAKALGSALNDEEWVQFAVIEALAKIKDDVSVGALVKALDKSSDLVASMIVEALGEMGNVKAVNMLLRRMDNSPTALRNKIVKAVVNILGGKSLTLLSPADRENFREYLLVALEDEDTEIQDAAMTGLAWVGGEDASSRILELAARMDPDCEQERMLAAVETLARIGRTSALEQALKGEESTAARLAVEVLARIEDPGVGELLRSIFWDVDRDIQRDIVQALLRISGPESSDFFLDVLSRSQDGTVIKAALGFLGSIVREERAGEAMFSLLRHPYDDVKEAALEACVALGSTMLESRFEAQLTSPDSLDRLMAVYALGKFGAAKHKTELIAALDDEVPDIRKVALDALGELCDTTDILNHLVSRLTDEVPEVRLAVIEILGQCMADTAVEYLIQTLRDPDDWVRIRAVEALAARRERSAIPDLVGLLDSENKLVVLKVIEGLGQIGGQAAFRALLDIANADDAEIQYAAEAALSFLQDNGEGE